MLSGLGQADDFSKWLWSLAQIHSQMMWKDVDIYYAMCHGLVDSQHCNGASENHAVEISLPGQKILCYPDVLQTPHTHCAYPINIENDLRVAICAQNTEKGTTAFRKI